MRHLISIMRLALIFVLLGYGFKAQAQGWPSMMSSGLQDTHLLQGPLKQSSQAVFMLRDGTASFVRYKGRIWVMTNNHVVGLKNCSLEGCWVPAYLNFEKGQTSKKVLMHLKPLAAQDDVDVAFFSYQVWTHQGKRLAFKPSYALSFAHPNTPTKDVYVIGHPRSGLKKFSKGKITRKQLGYLMVDALTLPGSSGSPILNTQGKIIGIHHSSSKRNDMWNDDGLIYQGRGSSLKPLLKVLSKAFKSPASTVKRATFVSLRHPQLTLSRAQQLSALFQSAKVMPNLTGGKNFFDELYRSCSRSLNPNAATLSSYRHSHQSCTLARKWLKCPTHSGQLFHKTSTSPITSQKLWSLGSESLAAVYYCPTDKVERKKWVELFRRVAHGYKGFVGADPLSWSFDSVLSLEDTPHKALKSLGPLFHDLRKNSKPSWDPRLLKRYSELLRVFPHTKKDFLRAALRVLMNYRQLPDYAFHLPTLAQSAQNLWKAGLMPYHLLTELLEKMLQDPALSLWAELAVERIHYESREEETLQKSSLAGPIPT